MKKLLLILLAPPLVMSACMFMPRDGGKNGREYLIGIGNDSAGLILQAAFKDDTSFNTYDTGMFGVYPVIDCCGSKSLWALSSGEIDAIVMCPDSAQELVEKNDGFCIAAPIVYEADVLITKGNSIKKIGYGQGRERQRALLEELYGDSAQFIPILYSSLTYALEKGEIDGAVVDALSAVQLDYTAMPLYSDEPSYVIVVRDELTKSNEYDLFISNLNKAIEDLDNPVAFERALKDFLNKDKVGEEVKKWEQLPVQYKAVGKP